MFEIKTVVSVIYVLVSFLSLQVDRFKWFSIVERTKYFGSLEPVVRDWYRYFFWTGLQWFFNSGPLIRTIRPCSHRVFREQIHCSTVPSESTWRIRNLKLF